MAQLSEKSRQVLKAYGLDIEANLKKVTASKGKTIVNPSPREEDKSYLAKGVVYKTIKPKSLEEIKKLIGHSDELVGSNKGLKVSPPPASVLKAIGEKSGSNEVKGHLLDAAKAYVYGDSKEIPSSVVKEIEKAFAGKWALNLAAADDIDIPSGQTFTIKNTDVFHAGNVTIHKGGQLLIDSNRPVTLFTKSLQVVP